MLSPSPPPSHLLSPLFQVNVTLIGKGPAGWPSVHVIHVRIRCAGKAHMKVQ